MKKTIVNIEDAESVEVGEVYAVNTVRLSEGHSLLSVRFPVLGDLHDDFQFLEVFPNEPHFHIDWRFIPHAVYDEMIREAADFQKHIDLQEKIVTPKTELASVIAESGVAEAPQRLPMRCVRGHSCWDNPSWLPAMEAAYKDKQVYDNKCPHRGISLVGAPEVDGVRICPGHGLAWDREGRLVPRATKGIE